MLVPARGDKKLFEEEPHESFPERNVWYPHQWLRSSLVFFSLILVTLLIAVVHFSFSQTFATYLWYVIVIYKLVGVVVEYIGEKIFEQKLLVVTISCMFGIVQALITFGASDFLDFLKSYFIELAIMMIERAYVTTVLDEFIEYVEDYYSRATRFLKRALGEEEQSSVFTDESMEAEKKPLNAKDLGIITSSPGKREDDLSDSNIILTEEVAQSYISDDSVDQDLDRAAAAFKEIHLLSRLRL